MSRVVVDVAQAHKSVRFVCTTQRGTVVHSPDLGISWDQIIDEEVPEAMRLLAVQVDQQFRLHLPELRFVRISHLTLSSAPTNPIAKIVWVPADSEDEQETAL